MTNETFSRIPMHITTPAQQQSPLRPLYRIGRILLTMLMTVSIIISILPVVMLLLTVSAALWIAVGLLLADVSIITAIIKFRTSLGNIALGMIGIMIVSVLAVFISQYLAFTPPITDENGTVVPGSIASLERVELNGSTQWITVRGYSKNLPVLLFLAGGPGGSELVMTRRYLGELEKHFIVVNWDQPGVGKSYNAVPRDQLTPDRFVEDAYALTLYLRERFGKDKIYVFGESWGSILGVWLVKQHPDLYHALISTGQVVDPVENDTEMYEFAIQLYSSRGDTEAVNRMRHSGPPPYEADVLVGKFQAMNGIINGYMESHAHGEGSGHNLMLDSLGASEYGLVDKVYWALSLLNTFPTVYSQLNDVDLRAQAAVLDVPVYFIRGRWDKNTSHRLAEEYFALLQAPHKEMIWFEDSAHTPMWDEPRHFVEVMINTVLAQQQP